MTLEVADEGSWSATPAESCHEKAQGVRGKDSNKLSIKLQLWPAAKATEEVGVLLPEM